MMKYINKRPEDKNIRTKETREPRGDNGLLAKRK